MTPNKKCLCATQDNLECPKGMSWGESFYYVRTSTSEYNLQFAKWEKVKSPEVDLASVKHYIQIKTEDYDFSKEHR
jgi:hypothetical protein